MALTCLRINEIRRMHAALCRPAHPPDYYLHKSLWRRRYQATAANGTTSGGTTGISN